MATPRLRDLASERAYAARIGGLFRIAGHALSRRLAPAESTAWQPDGEDVAAVSEPLSRIAARHSPLDPDGANDLIDGIDAGIGLFGWAVKADATARRDRRVANARVQVPVVPQAAAEAAPPPPSPVAASPVATSAAGLL